MFYLCSLADICGVRAKEDWTLNANTNFVWTLVLIYLKEMPE